jgi:hypothetical protein
MTIRKGEAWGQPAGVVTEITELDGDAAVAAALRARPDVPVTVIRGDLFRTAGAPAASRRAAGEALALPIDLLAVCLDDQPERYAAAHVVVGSSPWWRTRTVIFANAAFVGAANVAPRAHPNDGLVDVSDGRLAWRQRRHAHRLLPAGAHLPHPELAEKRTREHVVELSRPTAVRIDGIPAGRARRVAVRVIPDAGTVIL